MTDIIKNWIFGPSDFDKPDPGKEVKPKKVKEKPKELKQKPSKTKSLSARDRIERLKNKGDK